MVKVEDYKREMLFILFSQKTFILRIFFLIFISSILIALFWPPTYAAYGSFLLKSKELQKTPSAIEAMDFRQSDLKKEDLASEVEVIIANSTVENSLKRLHKMYPDKGYDMLKVTSVQSQLKTEILPASNVIKVTYFAKDTETAKQLLEVLMNEYIGARQNVLNSVAAKDFFSEQVQQYEVELSAKEKALHSLVIKTKVSNPEKQIESNIQLINGLETKLSDLKNQVINKSNLIKQLEEALCGIKQFEAGQCDNDIKSFTFIENAPLNHLSTRLMDVYSQAAETLKNYKEQSSQYEGVERQLKSLYKELRKEVAEYKNAQNSELDALKKQVANTEVEITSLNEHNVTLHKQIIDTNKIVRESGILTSTLETFAKRREEANVNSMKSDVNLFYSVNIIDKAYSLPDPVFPKKIITILLGLIVGFITGCSLGFIRSYLDHTFKSALDVERYLAMPILFSIENYDTTKGSSK
ncbi:MAG: hypothetical protein RIQ94_106 [Pseudomonadota bacterium]|jgi:uncharacterized protein involved in exopolysaccharide biosynthesis